MCSLSAYSNKKKGVGNISLFCLYFPNRYILDTYIDKYIPSNPALSMFWVEGLDVGRTFERLSIISILKSFQ